MDASQPLKAGVDVVRHDHCGEEGRKVGQSRKIYSG